MMPGQFGPMMRVLLPFAFACAHASAESCTGMPSVMTTSSGISASIASIMASFANAGGTKMIETSAPVSAMASLTVPYTWKRDAAVLDGRAGLARVDAADDLGAGLEHERRVLGALAARDALDDDLGVLVEEDRHSVLSLRSVRELGGLVGAVVHGCRRG